MLLAFRYFLLLVSSMVWISMMTTLSYFFSTWPITFRQGDTPGAQKQPISKTPILAQVTSELQLMLNPRTKFTQEAFYSYFSTKFNGKVTFSLPLQLVYFYVYACVCASVCACACFSVRLSVSKQYT